MANPNWNSSNSLKDNEILAAHLVHSICHMAVEKGMITYKEGYTANELYDKNFEAFNAIRQRYRDERNYSISLESVMQGVKWYLEYVR